MTQPNPNAPTFNLWVEPWITVERPDGQLERLNIPQTLTQAHQIHTLYEQAMPEEVAIHRLLVAILQAALNPRRKSDLEQVWRDGKFSAEAVRAFGEKYAHRFDLFSAAAPFLQSADLGLHPAKEDKAKPASYLFLEQPAGTAVTHYTHAYDEGQQFCSICATKGILLIPAFTLRGGRSMKASINEVPPMYVIPGGKTLFHSLAASLTRPPKFQPGTAEVDQPWWEHPPTIGKKAIVKRVGYLHSLTFPARRVRLHPQPGGAPCTRCGQRTPWHVATMVYEMGESLPKDAPWWRDPFAAYRRPRNKKEVKNPVPIRPVPGKAVWREFAGLLLPDKPEGGSPHAYRPGILDQLETLRYALPYTDDERIPLRVVGLRTDMKAKIFEWQESGFQLTPRLLSDPDCAKTIEQGLDFAARCDSMLKKTFYDYFGGEGKDKRLEAIAGHMSRRYWEILGQEFQRHIQGYTSQADIEALFHDWLDTVLRHATNLFTEAAETVPTYGYTRKPSVIKAYQNVPQQAVSKLRLQQEAINECRFRLYAYRKKHYPKEEIA